MSQSTERVRFCQSCQAVVGWFAIHCDACGQRVDADGDGSAQRLPEDAAAEMFRTHLRLIHRARERTARLDRRILKVTKKLDAIEARPGAQVAREVLLAMGERFLELEEEWAEVQREFNRESEKLEETFTERINEMDADIELPVERQAAMEDEVTALLSDLQGAEARLHEGTRRLDLARARAVPSGMRIVGIGAEQLPWVALAGFALSLALLSYAHFGAGAGWGWLVAVAAPVWVALAAVTGICASQNASNRA